MGTFRGELRSECHRRETRGFAQRAREIASVRFVAGFVDRRADAR
jgi:hypothetical protein